jgi:hypothetical protein
MDCPNRRFTVKGGVMPAKSRKQEQMMQIAEHNPSKLYAKNKAVLKMSKKQLHEFTTTKGLK